MLLLSCILFCIAIATAADVDLTKLLAPSSKRGQIVVRSGQDVVALVSPIWDQVVAKHQDGLIDPKQRASDVPAVLLPGEALYHFDAAKDGIVDSARFLLTFGVAASISEVIASHDPLAISIVQHDVETVSALLDAGSADPNSFRMVQDGVFDAPPLHLAVAVSKNEPDATQIVRVLLEAGAEVSAKARHGATSLMIASALNRPHLVRTLLEHGAKADEAHAFGRTTSVHFAAEMGHSEVLSVLCTWMRQHSQACDTLRTMAGGTPLHTAADSNRPNVVSVLVNDCQCGVNTLLNGDSTPLYLASQRGFVDVIHALADANANLDFVMPRDSAFAKERASNVRRGMVATGKDIGAQSIPYDHQNKNTERGNGATALHAAAENGHLGAVDALLVHGARQLDSMEGTSPLLIAIQYRHPEIALRLLQCVLCDVKVNAKSKNDGAFALFSASGFGYLEVVKAILERDGVDVNMKNKHGATSLSHAIYRDHLEIALILRDRTNVAKDIEACRAGVDQRHLDDARWFTLVEFIMMEQASLDSKECIMALVSREKMTARQVQLLSRALEQIKDVSKLVDLDTEGTNVFLSSARFGNVAALTMLYPRLQGMNFNSIRAGRKLANATMLYLAASENRIAAVEWLLSLGANVSIGALSSSNTEIPPIVVACEKGYANLARQLVRHGSNASFPVSLGGAEAVSPVQLAAMNSHVSIIEEFASESNADQILDSIVNSASSIGRLVEVLHRRGLLTNLDTRLRALTRVLLRQSQQAHARDHSDCLVAVRLLSSGWTLMRLDGVTLTPLHAVVIAYADQDDSEDLAMEFLQVLLTTSEDISRMVLTTTIKSKMTPIALAVEAQRSKLVKAMLVRMSEQDIQIVLRMKNGQGETPLQAARRLRDPMLISLLGAYDTGREEI